MGYYPNNRNNSFSILLTFQGSTYNVLDLIKESAVSESFWWCLFPTKLQATSVSLCAHRISLGRKWKYTVKDCIPDVFIFSLLWGTYCYTHPISLGGHTVQAESVHRPLFTKSSFFLCGIAHVCMSLNFADFSGSLLLLEDEPTVTYCAGIEGDEHFERAGPVLPWAGLSLWSWQCPVISFCTA